MPYLHFFLAFQLISLVACCHASYFSPQDEAHYWQAFILKAKKQDQDAIQLLQDIETGKHLEQPTWCNALPNTIADCFDKVFVAYIAHKPELLSFLGIFNSIGLCQPSAYLNSVSPSSIESHIDKQINALMLLSRYDVSSLTPEQRIAYDCSQWLLELKKEYKQFSLHKYYINQMWGLLHKTVVLFTQMHPITNQEDCNRYIERLERLPIKIEEMRQLLTKQQEAGIIPPRFALEKTVSLIDRIAPLESKDSLFITTLQIKAAEKQLDISVYLQQANEILIDRIYPALHRLKSFCEQIIPQAGYNGVWALPNGDAYYAHTLKMRTTTLLTPDEIHHIGLREVDAITKHITSIIASLGMANDKPIDTLSTLMQQSRFTDLDRCVTEAHTILKRSREKLNPLFDIKPKRPVDIKLVPEQTQKGCPVAYYLPPDFAGERPGTYYINPTCITELGSYMLETLTVHEAEPGHHFQLSIQQSLPIPLLSKMKGYTAYGEGWALYCEKLAFEQKFYSSPYHELASLQADLMRAARLVIDTGIHHLRWTYEQAIDYMIKTTGMSRDDVVTEIERYFVLPGQACAYKIGQLKFHELRTKAEQALKERFDIREFHNCVLKYGSLPLTILEKVVDQYIEKNREN